MPRFDDTGMNRSDGNLINALTCYRLVGHRDIGKGRLKVFRKTSLHRVCFFRPVLVCCQPLRVGVALGKYSVHIVDFPLIAGCGMHPVGDGWYDRVVFFNGYYALIDLR